MPSASDALRDRMKHYFGDPLDFLAPVEFLRSQGFTEENGVWRGPPRRFTPKEIDCLSFLIEEWDHDLITEPRSTTALAAALFALGVLLFFLLPTSVPTFIFVAVAVLLMLWRP